MKQALPALILLAVVIFLIAYVLPDAPTPATFTQ